MFNQRQLEIVLELCENADSFMTASHFAEKHQVSLRTVQNDVKQIKRELAKESCLSFQSQAPKGSRICMVNSADFTAFKERCYQQLTSVSMNYQGDRIRQLILLLLEQHHSISLYDIEGKLFVSHNTLLADLKQAEAVLSRYDLELLRGSNKVMADGSELNKRRCLSEENFLAADNQVITCSSGIDKAAIKNLLVESFVHVKRNISESAMNNTILMVDVAVQRMSSFFFIDDAELTDVPSAASMEQEMEIAGYFYRRISEKYHLRVPEAESLFLAIYLKGQGNFTTAEAISEEMNDFILDALRGIRRVFDIDLTDDLDLRIALALHCNSLIVRIRYDMQLKNQLADYVRQTYPLGYDVASYFAYPLQKKYGKRVTNEEIALIAIHFYHSLNRQQNRTGTKKVLVISSLRRSENILLRQTLYNWFPEQIAELFFVLPEDMDASYMDRYDTFITTEKGKFYDMGVAIYINQFPNRQDYLNVKLAMDGFKDIGDILAIFDPGQFTLFETGRPLDKRTILQTLCEKASAFYGVDGLEEAVMERENMRSTYFGSHIAAPHPMTAICSQTFICVGVTPDFVEWNSQKNRVNVILLVNIGKNNTKAFQLWSYLAKLFADRDFVKNLLADPTYEKFLALVKQDISDPNN